MCPGSVASVWSGVARQYEIDRSGRQQEHQETTKAGLFELDGLAQITILLGAKNFGQVAVDASVV